MLVDWQSLTARLPCHACQNMVDELHIIWLLAGWAYTMLFVMSGLLNQQTAV